MLINIDIPILTRRCSFKDKGRPKKPSLRIKSVVFPLLKFVEHKTIKDKRMDYIMSISKKTKVKAIQEALKTNEKLKDVTIGKINQEQTAELEQVVADVLFALAQEGKVKFADLGDFEVRETAARKGVNPAKLKELKAQGVDLETAKEQASIDIEAGQKFAFSASSTVKKAFKA